VRTCTMASALSNWSTARLAWQVVVMPVDEESLSSASGLVRLGLGGVVLFGDEAPPSFREQLGALVASAPAKIAPFVMTDEEGGAVQRLAMLIGQVPSARQMGATMTVTQITALGKATAEKMRALGVTMDLAPVMDVDGKPGPSVTDPDGTRSFSAQPAQASADSLAFAFGLEQGGVVPVAKHFPGLGGSSGNSDYTTSQTLSWESLQHSGLVPFERAIAAKLPAIMVANASIPGLSALPASLSPTVITTELRDRLGFRGLIVTDSLSAVSIERAGYSVNRAAVASLRAGADMVLFNALDADRVQATHGVAAAIVGAVKAGQLTRTRLIDAVSHVLVAKHDSPC
jgi:beta-N-acetylhexosaminidase